MISKARVYEATFPHATYQSFLKVKLHSSPKHPFCIIIVLIDILNKSKEDNQQTPELSTQIQANWHLSILFFKITFRNVRISYQQFAAISVNCHKIDPSINKEAMPLIAIQVPPYVFKSISLYCFEASAVQSVGHYVLSNDSSCHRHYSRHSRSISRELWQLPSLRHRYTDKYPGLESSHVSP